MVLRIGRGPYPLFCCLAIEIWHRLVYILNIERQGNLLVCVWSYIHYTKGYLAFLGIIHQAHLYASNTRVILVSYCYAGDTSDLTSSQRNLSVPSRSFIFPRVWLVQLRKDEREGDLLCHCFQTN